MSLERLLIKKGKLLIEKKSEKPSPKFGDTLRALRPGATDVLKKS